ncbi:hypothetical protein Pcinc_021993 [Petrolisthes cinctipes]|uniref:Uncharacterized protein n=1 Tax=Petrolisthes cinctipes TaxID=88211 RepID=A0AAE1FEZ1_PETCI|nr:hypothetical protein Pcinc_021993 [Petrolisthes cinctipes]
MIKVVWLLVTVVTLPRPGLSLALGPQSMMAWQTTRDSNSDHLHHQSSENGATRTVAHLSSEWKAGQEESVVEGRGGSVLLDSLFGLGLRDMQQQQQQVQQQQQQSYTTHASDPHPHESGLDYVSKVEEAFVSAPINNSDAAITDTLKMADDTSERLNYLINVLVFNSSTITDKNEGDKTQLLRYLESVQEDVWGQFRSTAIGYLELLEQEYDNQELTGRLPVNLIKSLIYLADNLNMVGDLGKNMDPGLKTYLKDRLYSLVNEIPVLSRTSDLLSFVSRGVVRDAAWKTLHQFVQHILWVMRNYVNKEDIEQYKTELKRTAPLAAYGMDLLLGSSPLPQMSEGGRSLFSHQGYVGGYSDGHIGGGDIQSKGYINSGYGGYGSNVGYGGYGSHDGYGTSSYDKGYGLYLDPYLVLAGLGAATLLGYLGYKIILSKTSTMRRRRSVEDLEFSDMVDLSQQVHGALEVAEARYEFSEASHGSSSPLDDLDNLLEGLNAVWREQESDSGCVSCSIVDFVVTHTITGRDQLIGFIMAGLAHMLGSERSGQLLDEVTNRILGGHQVTWDQKGNTCVLK